MPVVQSPLHQMARSTQSESSSVPCADKRTPRPSSSSTQQARISLCLMLEALPKVGML